MAKIFEADNFDTLFARVVSHINDNPEYTCKPRGQAVRELIAPTLVLTNPRARLLSNQARKADYGFAVGEFMWYWTGKQDVESMLYYNKRMGNFSDDGFTLNSAYGYRTRVAGWGPDAEWTQWDAVRKTLLEDPDSRRAIMVIGEPSDYVFGAHRPSKDLPCTLNLQFFIRDNKLRLHTTMRSNDAFWGLTYDLFSFTLLQEAMCQQLRWAGMSGLELGEYTHTAASLHIYDRHFGQASEVVSEYLSPQFHPAAPMEPIDVGELASLAIDEVALRTGKVARIGSSEYSGGLQWMAEQLNAHRRKRDAERGGQVGPGDGARAQQL